MYEYHVFPVQYRSLSNLYFYSIQSCLLVLIPFVDTFPLSCHKFILCSDDVSVLTCARCKHCRSNVQFVSCHPGWTDTPGVDAAFGSQKKYLQPLRSMWQGAEGIAWLAVASAGDIESGSFYLDRTPQVKHISGFFAREGSFTKNSQDDIDTMMKTLDKWSTEPEQHPDFQSSE
eukprot:m.418988 g.418988  ORF g.418988 m.418988 type:complete len:174 (+) comp21297_c0_seq5:1229-1750(+)